MAGPSAAGHSRGCRGWLLFDFGRTSFFKSIVRATTESFVSTRSIKFRAGADSRAIKFSVYKHTEPRIVTTAANASTETSNFVQNCSICSVCFTSCCWLAIAVRWLSVFSVHRRLERNSYRVSTLCRRSRSVDFLSLKTGRKYTANFFNNMLIFFM